MFASHCLNCKRIYRIVNPEEPGLIYSHGLCSTECKHAMYPELYQEEINVSRMEAAAAEGAPELATGPRAGSTGRPVHHNPQDVRHDPVGG